MNAQSQALRATILAVCLLTPATAAHAQTPGYITAKPDAAIRAFGSETARKIFSGVYTAVRQEAVVRSQKTVPGFDCPTDPKIALAEVIPFPLKPGMCRGSNAIWLSARRTPCAIS